MFTPTRLYCVSQLSCDSISHQTIVVGNPNSLDGVLTCELRPNGANGVEQETRFCVKLASSQVKKLNRVAVIGYTQMTNREILQEACALIKKHGTYDFLQRNCQHFTYALAKCIMGEIVIKPNCDARYCFTQEILQLVNQPFTGIQDGWIFPTATTVLVDVKETEKADTWFGQVEGSEENGMFRRNTVERVL